MISKDSSVALNSLSKSSRFASNPTGIDTPYLVQSARLLLREDLEYLRLLHCAKEPVVLLIRVD